MTLLPPGVKVHLAFGYIDMRKGIDGLAMLVQGVLRQDRWKQELTPAVPMFVDVEVTDANAPCDAAHGNEEHAS